MGTKALLIYLLFLYLFRGWIFGTNETNEGESQEDDMND